MLRDSLWGRIRARRLANTVYVLVAFSMLLLLSIGIYLLSDKVIAKEIFFGLFTSLMASILIMVFELFTKYKDFENAEFIDSLYAFGIHNLHFDKKSLLVRLIGDAKDELWVTGYRLILTAELSHEILAALNRGVKVRVLACPPWHEAFRLTFGDTRGVIDNYFRVLSLAMCMDQPLQPGQLEIRFTKSPLFNDTYKVDGAIVTSPFMHNRDPIHGVLTAHDFFTYELDSRYKLFELMRSEYVELWDSASTELPSDALSSVSDFYLTHDLPEQDYVDFIVGSLRPVDRRQRLTGDADEGI